MYHGFYLLSLQKVFSVGREKDEKILWHNGVNCATQKLAPLDGNHKSHQRICTNISEIQSIPYAPCLEYLPTFPPKMGQM